MDAMALDSTNRVCAEVVTTGEACRETLAVARLARVTSRWDNVPGDIVIDRRLDSNFEVRGRLDGHVAKALEERAVSLE